MKTNEIEHKVVTYEIVYSKDRQTIIQRSDWLYQKDWKNYEAAAVSSEDLGIDPNLWVSASLDDHVDLAMRKRR